MSPNVKKGILIALGITSAVVVGILIYNKFKKPIADTPQGFNELAERITKSHPEIYAWWEGLTIGQQIQIENSMTPEILAFLSREFTKKELSDQAKELLRRVGYRG